MTRDEFREIMLWLRGQGVKNFKALGTKVNYGYRTLKKFHDGTGILGTEVTDRIRELVWPRVQEAPVEPSPSPGRKVRGSDAPARGKRKLRYVLELYEIVD
jgi:hypothetical protein